MPCLCLLQWLRPKVIYNYGANIVNKDGVKQAFGFREHSMFENPKCVSQYLTCPAHWPGGPYLSYIRNVPWMCLKF